MLVEFLKNFSYSTSTIIEVSSYLSKHYDDIELFVEDSDGYMGELFHSDFQKTILDMLVINDNESLKSDNDKKEVERLVKLQLEKQLITSFESVAKIKSGSTLTKEEIANHFVENSFAPLLDVAKKVASTVHKPE